MKKSEEANIIKWAETKSDEELKEEYSAFQEEQAEWLEDFAVYMVCKDLHEGKEWYNWDEKYRKSTQKIKTEIKKERKQEVDYYSFVQFIFYKEWEELKAYANEKEIKIIFDKAVSARKAREAAKKARDAARAIEKKKKETKKQDDVMKKIKKEELTSVNSCIVVSYTICIVGIPSVDFNVITFADYGYV